ncbi:TadE/TadG family type IV pilus assembly protein [Streptomyces sp. NPDC050619]|uniref:TadE/TadG family type IV pilus assembly protein n=1 Tax=Streptomyces sp. NPDC050619 TaxID=3157214 RepID=UPI00343346C3
MSSDMSYDGEGRGSYDGKGRGRDRGRDRRGRDRRRDRRRDRGQVALEYLGFIPILILVAMAGVQIGLIAYTAQQAGTAARAGARAASLEPGAAQEGCQNAVSSWLADQTECTEAPGAEEVTVTARIAIPQFVPGWDFGDAQKTATMPLDH